MTKVSSSPEPRRLAVYDEAITLEDLCRGRTRYALIRDMALAELSDRELALQIGCDLPTLKAFRALYQTEIAEVVSALAGRLAMETAGLWIAKKANRVAEIQSDVEQINAAMKWFEYDDEGNLAPMLMASREHDRLLRAKHFALSQVASEYSAAEKRSSEDGAPPIRYILEMDEDVSEALS